ncbi:MAG: YidC/Oxa1 family membrane protein insertase [Clostridiales bacterium]|nr:YidC/Oxa1 family membrane protein insertase [Clostridiales bacterium]
MLLLLRIIMWPFSQLLNILFTLTGSYGLAIILFAVVIKLLMLYPSAKSKRNMMHMSRMNPKMQEIKKRCGNNQEKYALEIQKLYQEEHVNPMGGCLWSLLPLPILIALYGIIRRPVINFMLINQHRPKALENLEIIRERLTDLGYQITGQAAYEEISIAKGVTEHLEEIKAVVPQVFPIDFNFIGIDLTAIPTQAFGQFMSGSFSWNLLALVMIPIISGLLNLLLMVISQRTNVTTDDAMKSQQTMMMVMMPLMSVYIGFILPASLGLYWITMSVFSIVQELILQKHYGKKLDQEEAEREEAARQDRIRRMEAAKNRPQTPVKNSNTSKDKQKRLTQQNAPQKKKNSTTEAGRVGDRPYARGRSFSGSHYEDLPDEVYAKDEKK